MTLPVEQITAMMYDYCELFDTADFGSFAAQFEYGQWHRADPGAPVPAAGSIQNIYLYDGMPRTKRVTTNVVVVVDEHMMRRPATLTFRSFRRCPACLLQPVFSGGAETGSPALTTGTWRWSAARSLVIFTATCRAT